MFEQNPVLGPGAGTTTTHTLEILLMLAGAFLLGLWLGWLLWNRFKAIYDTLLAEHESTKLQLETTSTELASAQKRIAQFEVDQSTMRGRIDSLTADYHDSEARFQQLNGHLSRLSEKAASLEYELDEIRPAEIPMEIVESPVDVHVESLVGLLPAAEVEELVVESPVVEEVAIEVPVEAAVLPETIEAVPESVDEPVAIAAPFVTKTFTNPPVIIERVTVHQPYVEETPVDAAPPPTETGVETVAETPIAVPVFSFAPAASPDDLRIVEGIGPKIEQVLNENGISTFLQLSETSEERLREILAAAGGRFKVHDPATWPAQARMAFVGDWEILKSWQEVLKSGKQVEVDETVQLAENQSVETENTAIIEETPVIAASEISTNGIYAEPEIIPDSVLTTAADNLKVVEGIGPKIEELLNKNSISTFSELAGTPVARLKEILESGGSRYAIHDPGTWPAQSLLAANGEWENLKSYQGFLNAGKRPE